MALKDLVLNNFRGMNRLSDPLNMSPEFSWDIHNGYIKKDIKSELGVIQQRSGTTKYNSVTFTNPCRYIFEAKWDGGSVDTIIREGNRWAKFDGVNTFTDLDTGRTSDVRGQAVMFGNQLIMADGGKLRKCTSGYAVSDLSSDSAMPADSTAVHVHDHKVWTNSTANPMKAYGSKSDSANASDSFSAADDSVILDFSKILPSGDTLLGFKTFSNRFLVFVFRRYLVVYVAGTDPANFALQQIVDCNCVSWHGILPIANDLAIPSLEGVNSLSSAVINQDLTTDDLTKYVAPLYRDLLSQLSDPADISSGFSHTLNHLYLGLPISGNHTILVYSLDIKNFVGRWTGVDSYSFCELRDGMMLVGGTGYVHIMNSGTSDDGAAISFSYQFPSLYAKSPDNNKAFRQIEGLIRFDGDPILNIDYSYAIDDSLGALPPIQLNFTSLGGLWDVSAWDVTDWAGSSSSRFLSSDMLGRGKQLELTLSNEFLDSILEIFYIILRYRLEGRKIR